MTPYPVTFDVVGSMPEKYQRPQVFLRIVVAILLGLIMPFVYLGFPILAAIWISQKGSQKFMDEDGPKMTGWLRSLVAYYAYVYMLTDKLPSDPMEEHVEFDVQRSGSPTVGSALLRLIFSIPSGIVLGILGWVAEILWLVAAVMVLVQETYPEGIYKFMRGSVRWQARLLGYHSSLVDQYPPFALDMEPEGAGPAA